MKRGDKVWCCHDGKFSRRVEGVVTQQHKGHHITVQFEFDDQLVTLRARRNPAIRCRQLKGYIMKHKRPVRFSGWADIDYFCPWFSIVKMKASKK